MRKTVQWEGGGGWGECQWDSEADMRAFYSRTLSVSFFSQIFNLSTLINMLNYNYLTSSAICLMPKFIPFFYRPRSWDYARN